LAFACLGGWIGHRLTARGRADGFVVNHAAIAALGLSQREVEVLGLLAEGCANKVVARRLGISPNTVKTHVARLFEKLEVASRTQAIARARELGVVA
jgi:ATP/maltotriose-dependent transcriptional regulator MalT